MKVLRNLTMDNLINYYEGIVVNDRKAMSYGSTPQDDDLNRRVLAQDEMVLGALKCAKAVGYSGEK